MDSAAVPAETRPAFGIYHQPIIMKKNVTYLSSAIIGFFFLSVLGCENNGTGGNAGVASEQQGRVAIARLEPTEGNSTRGIVTFIEEGDGIRVIADISEIAQGMHGFHVHENGDCSAPDASSAGGHFNPTGDPHAGPDAEARHVGDLGNIEASDTQTAQMERVDKHLTFDGENSIIGKAVVVHAGEDDLSSQPSGDAGGRIACGVIELQE